MTETNRLGLLVFFMLKEFEPTIIKLAKSSHIRPLEWQDIAQELRLYLWEEEKKTKKPIKSYKNWAYIVCRHKLGKLRRYYTQQKRDERKIVSLDMLMERGFDKEG